MTPTWETITCGPDDARHGVLLLPGGACPAESYAPLLAQPALAHVRLVAATMPGHAGTPPPADFSIEHYAKLAAGLAQEHRCDVVVGFSIGATVALEMVAGGLHNGPVVLLGISLSAADEPAFFRVLVRLSAPLRDLPVALLMRMTALATRTAKVPAEHRQVLAAALRRNDPHVLRRAMVAYLSYLEAHPSPATALCSAGVPAWVVHAEKGDGGLTDEERAALSACPSVRVVTFPGTTFFLPDEKPREIAEILVEAVRAAG